MQTFHHLYCERYTWSSFQCTLVLLDLSNCRLRELRSGLRIWLGWFLIYKVRNHWVRKSKTFFDSLVCPLQSSRTVPWLLMSCYTCPLTWGRTREQQIHKIRNLIIFINLTLRFFCSLWFFWASVTLSSSLRSRTMPGIVSSALASALLSSVSSWSCIWGWTDSWIWTPMSLVFSSSLVRSKSASTTTACRHRRLAVKCCGWKLK